jgi:hypothetical protein
MKNNNEIRQEHPPQRRHFRFTVLAVVVAGCTLVLCAVQGRLGYPFRKTIALGTTKFVPVEGSAYSAPLLAQYTPWGAQAASARLYEDTTVSSRYSQRATSVSGFGKGIFHSPKRDDCSSLRVTTPIHEPTAGTTGSRYHAVYQKGFCLSVSLHG